MTTTSKTVTRRKKAPAKLEGFDFAGMIERAATNPETDVVKMKELWDMSKEMMAMKAKADYNRDMSLVQSLVPSIKKDARNDQTQSNYATLENIVNKIQPVYTEHGFSLAFSEDECPTESMIRVHLAVSHNDGDTRHFYYDSPMDVAGIKGTRNKTDTHGKASAMSYGQRYLLKLIFMLDFSGEDDDGNAAGAPVEYITEKQIKIIDEMIALNDLPAKPIAAWLTAKFGSAMLEDIPTTAFEAVINKLNVTIKAKKAVAEADPA